MCCCVKRLDPYELVQLPAAMYVRITLREELANHRDSVEQLPSGQQWDDRFLGQLLEVASSGRCRRSPRRRFTGLVERQLYATQELTNCRSCLEPATVPESRWSCGCSFNHEKNRYLHGRLNSSNLIRPAVRKRISAVPVRPNREPQLRPKGERLTVRGLPGGCRLLPRASARSSSLIIAGKSASC